MNSQILLVVAMMVIIIVIVSECIVIYGYDNNSQLPLLCENAWSRKRRLKGG
jgi:hypothetical protein